MAFVSQKMLILIVVAGILIMSVPLIMTVYMSFFADGVIAFPPSGYSFAWYGRLGEFPKLTASLLTSLQVASLSTAGSLLFGVPASIALVRYNIPGKSGLNVLLLSPLTVPGIVLGLGIYVLIVAIAIRTDLNLVGSSAALVVSHLLITMPWSIRLCVASLMDFNRSIEEAAASLGASPVRVLWAITLSSMRPALVAAGLFSFIVSFENIEMTLFLISPGTTTFPISVLQYLQYRVDPLVAAVAVLQTGVIAIVLLIVDRYAKLARIV